MSFLATDSFLEAALMIAVLAFLVPLVVRAAYTMGLACVLGVVFAVAGLLKDEPKI